MTKEESDPRSGWKMIRHAETNESIVGWERTNGVKKKGSG